MPPRFAWLSNMPRPARWGILITLSAFFAALLTWARLPAALMLGPMIAAILVEIGHAEIRVPRIPFNIAQGVIGCMVANVLTPEILHSFLRQWPVFLTVVLIIIAFTCVLGWIISKLGILPGTTAIWGLLPGAASVMMLMAEAHGADSRLVAFMQYLRVVMVAIVASLIARFWVHATATAAPIIWFPELHDLAFLETLALIAGGVTLGHFSKLPAGMLLVPMFLGTALHASGRIDIELPKWLLAASYLCLGWSTGLRFSWDVLVHAVRALPQIILSILVVILFCGGLSLVLVRLLDIAPLTAYLATSPGGADGVAIIAAATPVDVGFVMALQIARFMLVLIIGPVLSRFVADRVK